MRHSSVWLVFLTGIALLVSLFGACSSDQSKAPPLTQSLSFPSDQFDELMYVPRQSTTTSALDAEYEAVLKDIREANFEPLGRLNPDDEKRILSRPIGLLKVNLNTGQYTTCTASVIDADKILTNWHCLPKFGSQVTRAVLQMGFYDANNEQGVQRYTVALTPLETDQGLDYAILRVEGDLSEWGRVLIGSETPSERRSLTIIDHPAGLPKHITQRRCQTGDPAIVRNRLTHFCDTVKGSSGAPIFSGSGTDMKMIALHYAGVPRSLAEYDPAFEFNRAVLITEILNNSQVLRGLSARPSAILDSDGIAARLESSNVANNSSPDINFLEYSSSNFNPGSTFRDNLSGGGEGPEMVVVPPGRFVMGSPEYEAGRDADEGPQRTVTISYQFAVGKYEISWSEWEACVADYGCDGTGPESSGGDNGWGKGNRPVIEVDWDDAQNYVNWLSRKTGENYRLLSESEWEYVARSGAASHYSWGNTANHEFANYGAEKCCEGATLDQDRWLNTSPVGAFKANKFGLNDMHGNVWEWTQDCWNESYVGAPTNGDAWESGDCTRRMLRGGSWRVPPGWMRSADRSRHVKGNRLFTVGFRVARALETDAGSKHSRETLEVQEIRGEPKKSDFWNAITDEEWSRVGDRSLLDTYFKQSTEPILLEAAQNGNANAQTLIGIAHNQGVSFLGYPYDHLKAVKYLRLACDQNQMRACGLLGQAISHPARATNSESIEGFGLMKEACDSGATLYCWRVAFEFSSGRYIERDLESARAYAKTSCERGSRNGCELYDELNR